MIPIRLAVEGLYSYQHRQEINFKPLIDSGLFGIFGQVGSGKTSLLEAISFVLYGRSERLNKTDNRAYNMMNLRMSQMRIEFEFRAGADDHRYRYTYEAKRNRKQHHDVNTGDRKVYRWESDQWLPQSIEKTDVAVFTKAVLGLDYENFKRTIIIPQNQFREFLELAPTERTAMMSQLFDLGRFDLADRAKQLDEANQTELDTLTGQLSGLGAATPEAVEAALAEVETARLTIAQHNDEIQTLDSEEKRLLKLAERHAELAKARADLYTLTTEKPAFDALETQLDQYERIDRAFRVPLVQRADVIRKQREKAAPIPALTAKITALERDLPGLEQQRDTTLLSFQNRHKVQEQIEEQGVVRLIRSNQHSVEGVTGLIQSLREQVDGQTEAIRKKDADRQQQQATQTAIGQPATRLMTLNEVQRWFDRDKNLQEASERITKKIRANETKLADIRQQKDAGLAGFAPAWAGQNLTALLPVVEQEMADLKIRQTTQKADHDENLLRQRLHQFAEALTDGKPCPLCGAVHHPAIHEDTDIDQVVKTSADALHKLTVRLDELTALLGQLQTLRTELKAVVTQEKELLAEKNQAETDRQNHLDKFAWSNFSPTDPAAVRTAIGQETANQTRLAEVQKKIDQLTRDLEKDRAAQSKTIADISGHSASLASLKTLITNQLGQLKHIRPDEVSAFKLNQIDATIRQLEAQFERTETSYKRANDAFTVAKDQHLRLQSERQQLVQLQADYQLDIDTQNRALTDALAEHNQTQSSVEAILATNLDTVTGHKKLREFTARLTAARTKTDDLQTELSNNPFNISELSQIQADHQTAKTNRDAANQQLGECTKAHAHLSDQWTQKQAFAGRLQALTLRREDLKTMRDLFHAKGFVNYVSSVRLSELCGTANERFSQLTNNQLRLEFLNDNFYIRDFTNGGKTRLAKTLSGGQMFQAALSLALALSDNIQHLTHAKQNLFFLDEGFGTLDKLSLQTVFETLKSLRRENRVVGIISHVDELQQEVETHIRTISTDAGSQIRCSWE